jgi:hypothetical protein
VLQQDESEVQHVLRASANHPQAVDLVSQESKELKCTDAIQSGLDDLIEQHWDFEIQRRISTETFSIPYPSLCEGSKLTRASYLAFREIYKQGFKVTLIPLNNDASVQVISALIFSNSELISAHDTRISMKHNKIA